ncbi:MAG: carbon-nitrogen hydrolase family protein [Armatimonadetes bacterium]|nr:carbon-nitrogen hydrolase family protein [Armatimonadota bacterium]MDW8122055.1 carbon-nitrogen hydrolase family protein [Armatimonadota bacterium]
MADKVVVASVQMEPIFGRVGENLEKISSLSRQAAQTGAQLVLFPECALTGYCFESRQEALSVAVETDGEPTKRLSQLSKDLSVWLIVGTAERSGDNLFNSLFMISPEGLSWVYRKIHLPCIGLDRFADAGDGPLKVVSTAVGRLGLHICYDAIFPEVARVLTLDGAEVLCLATNWPEGARPIAQFVPITRTLENRVHYVVSNRIGTEGGFRFIGHSQIVDADGKLRKRAGEKEETILIEELDLTVPRNKRIVFQEGKYEVNRVGDRRPEFYRLLTESPAPSATKG